jgi:hypothetical protein
MRNAIFAGTFTLCFLLALSVSPWTTSASTRSNLQNISGSNVQNTYGLQFTPPPPELEGGNVTINAWTANLQVNNISIQVIAPHNGSTTMYFSPSSCTIETTNQSNGMCATTTILDLLRGHYKVHVNFYIQRTISKGNVREVLKGGAIQSFAVEKNGNALATTNLQNTYGLQFSPIPPEHKGSNVTILAWTANLQVNNVSIEIKAHGHNSTTYLVPTSCTIPLNGHPDGVCATITMPGVMFRHYKVHVNFYIDAVVKGVPVQYLRGTVFQSFAVHSLNPTS